MSTFHEEWAKMCLLDCSHVFTIYIKENFPRPGGHVFLLTTTIFKLVRDIHITNIQTIFELNLRSRSLTHVNRSWDDVVVVVVGHSHTAAETNVLTKFHEDWAKNVSYRLFICFHDIHIEKTVIPTGGQVFPPTMTIFKLVRDIYKIDVHNFFMMIRQIMKMTPPPSGGNVFFSPIRTIFELNRHIQKTHVLTKFHEDWTNNVTSRRKLPGPLAAMFSSPIWTIFELVRDINEINVLTKCHDDWAIIVTSRGFTRFLFNHIGNTAPPPDGHINILTKLHEDWASNVTSTVFELSMCINRPNVLTKFHEDQTINMASGVFTWQNVDDTRLTKGDHKSSP
ncbi:hypothetical protein DPMN_176464 [Dreissena polymorpha]|uniref:Uncharacterized protein n=1 Tax=Dreissena polymorpha TaxID=45954 RepID=A0A9D4IKM1_DREPO|nr:hypothetical protein DPMN_176464 [Dreissena polymorpha]